MTVKIVLFILMVIYGISFYYARKYYQRGYLLKVEFVDILFVILPFINTVVAIDYFISKYMYNTYNYSDNKKCLLLDKINELGDLITNRFFDIKK